MRFSALATLSTWVTQCSSEDAYPLSYSLSSFLETLLGQSIGKPLGTATEEQWMLVYGMLSKCLDQLQVLLEQLSLGVEVTFPGREHEQWLHKLKTDTHVPIRSSFHCRWSCGIVEATHPKNADGTPPKAIELHSATDYHPPPVLQVLQSMRLPEASSYRLCLHCLDITGNLPRHMACEHPGLNISAREPTIHDVIQRVNEFAEQWDRKGLNQFELEPNDIHALHLYLMETAIQHEVIRCMLDLRDVTLCQWRPLIHHIHTALNKLPVYDRSGVYCCIPNKVSGYVEGSIVQWKSFVSATVHAPLLSEILKDKGSLFIIKPHPLGKARLLSSLSTYTREGEVLFDANSWFRVVRKVPSGTRRVLSVELGMSLADHDVYELEELTEMQAQEANKGAKERHVQREAVSPRAELTSELFRHMQESNTAGCLQVIQKGADVDGIHNGCSALIMALQRNLPQVCTALLEKGANANVVDTNGSSFIVLAALKGWHDVCTQAPGQAHLSIGDSLNLRCFGVEAFVPYLGKVQDLRIGSRNHIGAPGAELLVTKAANLQCLEIGTCNDLGLEGALAIHQSAPNLMYLSIGGWAMASGADAISVTEHCKTISSLALGGGSVGADGIIAMGVFCPELVSLSIAPETIDMTAAQAFPSHWPSLTSLIIGRRNKVQCLGMQAIAQRCSILQSLSVGDDCDIGPIGAYAIGTHCHALTSLSIGARNDIRCYGLCSIASGCTALLKLSIGDHNAVQERGIMEVAKYCHALTDITIGGWNLLTPLSIQALLSQCRYVTTISLGSYNDIGQQGASFIAEFGERLTDLDVGSGNGLTALAVAEMVCHCPHLVKLTIGHENNVKKDGALAIAAHCERLTHLSIGGRNFIGPEGTAAIVQHCTNLKALAIGGWNDVGEMGARAVATCGLPFVSLAIGHDNNIPESAANAIIHYCTTVVDLKLDDWKNLPKK